MGLVLATYPASLTMMAMYHMSIECKSKAPIVTRFTRPHAVML